MLKKQYLKPLMKILLFLKGIVHKSTQYVAERLLAWQKPTHLNFSVFKTKRTKYKKNVTTNRSFIGSLRFSTTMYSLHYRLFVAFKNMKN